jgi:hypothetical protein
MPDWSTAEWTQVAATVAAAIAAIAAGVTAVVSIRQQRRFQWPGLSAGLLRNMTTGQLSATFFNGGPGVAVEVMYLLVCGTHKIGGLLESGHLAVGQSADVDFHIIAGKGEKGYLMWACGDVNRNVYIWSSEWRYRRYSRRQWLRKRHHDENPSLVDMFRMIHPEVPVSE